VTGGHLLVVEDDPDARALMVMALEHGGHTVDAAASAERALDLLSRSQYDVLLTDFRLPGRSGRWLLHEAGAQGLLRDTATLLVTADAEPDVSAGDCDAVVQKPLNWATFVPFVNALLAQRTETGSGAADPGKNEPPMPQPIELVMYVTPASLACDKAMRALEETLSRYDSSRIKVKVVDITLDSASAANDRIIFTPALVKRTPPPQVWVLGDLSRPHVLPDLLRMWGVPLLEET